jgi:hypothetical protein
VLPRLLARSWPVLLLWVPSISFPLKGVYDPRAFIPHAALLRQAFAHCARFPTAASRRSLGRVSVPVWLVVLSDQLPVDALVGRYPTNKLIGREPLPKRKTFLVMPCDLTRASGIRPGFPGLSQTWGQVAHVLLTRSPLALHRCCHRMVPARLACIKHAASVRPEPGSNSPSKPCHPGDPGKTIYEEPAIAGRPKTPDTADWLRRSVVRLRYEMTIRGGCAA